MGDDAEGARYALEAARELWPQLAVQDRDSDLGWRLVNHSENQTFRMEVPGSAPVMLRLHRPHYQSAASIRSELVWLAAVRNQTDLPIPQALPGKNGDVLQSVATPDGDRQHAVLFAFIAGDEPSLEDDPTELFLTLGRYAARLHRQAMAWTPPENFTRQAWSARAILDPDGLWGDWRQAPGLSGERVAVLERLDARLRQRLADYGTGPDRYGLIHADMRLGNLLVSDERVSLIDFDDCGFCWFGYDFAAAISFYETHPAIPALKRAWLAGYRAVRPLAETHVAMLDTLVMLRRMALLAWIGSHAETDLARAHHPDFARDTATLAERYLRGPLWD